MATRSINKTYPHTTQSVPLCFLHWKLKLFPCYYELPQFQPGEKKQLGKAALRLSFCAAFLLLLPPHLQLPSEKLQAPDRTRVADHWHWPRGWKRKRVTFSAWAPVGPVLIILVYLLHANGGELTIAAKQSLCLPWQGGEIYPAYSTREGACVLFEFERSRNTLLFHFPLSQLPALVPKRPFWNCSRPLSQGFLWEAKQFQSDFHPGLPSLRLQQHQCGGRSPCQRSSPGAVWIQRFVSCQRKQRGWKAAESGTLQRLRQACNGWAEYSTEARVFSILHSTAEAAAPLCSLASLCRSAHDPTHCPGASAAPHGSRQGWQTHSASTPNAGCPALLRWKVWRKSSRKTLLTTQQAAWLSLRIRVKYDRHAFLKAQPQEQNSSLPKAVRWQHKLLNLACRNRKALVCLCGLGEKENNILGLVNCTGILNRECWKHLCPCS